MKIRNAVLAAALAACAVCSAAPERISPAPAWKGKKVAFIGDSITDPRHVGCTKNYWEYLEETLGIEKRVYAVSGYRWCHALGLAEKLKLDWGDEVDAILVFLGTNDYNGSVPLGTWWDVVETDYSGHGKTMHGKRRTPNEAPDTVRGRINATLDYLKENFPDQQIVLLTPIHRAFASFGGTNVQPDESYPNELGLYIHDYVDVVKEAGAIWSVPVIDLFADSGLYPLAAAQNKYFHRADTDLLHPSDLGHERMARTIAARLAALPPDFKEKEWLPAVTCHRGGYEYDDNALGSFKDSDKHGLKRFETDFRFTRDHHFVLMHDDTMDRTTTGSGYVEDHTLAELRKLSLKRSGEPIPTGEEVISYFKGREDVFLLLELKTYNHKPGAPFYTDAVAEEFCRKLTDLTRRYLVPGTYAFVSTDYRSLRILRRIDPQAKIILTLYDKFSDVWLNLAKELKCCAFGQWVGGLHPGDVERIHAAGMQVELWPILSMGDYARARKYGSDSVCVDTPKEFMRRITMPQSARYDFGKIRTSWDKSHVRIDTPHLSRVYKLSERGLQPVSYVRDGVAQKETAEAPNAAFSSFSRCTAGCLKLDDEIGVRVTVLTDDGEEQIDVKESTADVVRRKLPSRVAFGGGKK